MRCAEKSEPVVLRLTRCREAAEGAGDDLLVYLIEMAIQRAKEARGEETADPPDNADEITALAAQMSWR